MSVARYMALRAEVARLREQAQDTPEEDRLLDQMDDVWRSLSRQAHEQIRTLVAEERRFLSDRPIAIAGVAGTAVMSNEIPGIAGTHSTRKARPTDRPIIQFDATAAI
jgi:hypothetical protein